MSALPSKILAIVFGVVGLWALWIVADGNRPYLRSMNPAVVEIAPGTRSIQIAQQLEDAGAIRSRETFLLLHYLRPQQTLKAGDYVFDHPASTKDVLRQLVLGQVANEAVTIPEGYNRFQIADLVAASGLASREEFLQATEDPSPVANFDPEAQNVEGYLFPDTYQFTRHAGAARIVRAMVNRFRKVYSGLLNPSIKTHPKEIVTMASLVELETGNREERPLVASVFYNRLKQDIPLQCDPTVVYAAMLESKYKGRIGQIQLRSNSPYNTYTHAGLPPGPIANPGRASLLAALHPATSKYLYFVANPTGHHTFSTTLAEHNLAVGLYRRNLDR